MRVPKRVKLPAVIAAGVVLVGGGTAYAVVGGEDAPTYRTVAARTGDVEQTLTLSGVVDAARRSDLSFGTDGTVATVKVAQGDAVKAGQVIATLDTEDLDAAVTQAESALASAKAQLESDQDAQTSSVEQAAGPSRPSGGTNPGGGTSNGTGSSNAATAALLKKLKAQQQTVLDAQSAASAAITAANAALAAQTAACADAYQAPATPSGDAPATGDTAASEDTNAACDAALADVQEKQAAVKDAQAALQDALTELGRTLTSALGTVANQPTGATSARTSASSAAAVDVPSGGNGSDSSSNGSSGGSSGTVTAARLASDQAQIDQAEADLVSARAARAQAVLRSTRSGTVASLDLAKGDSVSTGTAVAVVVGGKAVTLTGTVAETSVDDVKVGQVARITVAGSSTATEGTVTAIGLTADTSSGSTSYPVTVTVEDPSIALPTGSRAQVAIVISTAQDVVTLPISAVTKNGDTAVVRTWDGSSLKRTTVTLGAVGTRTVAITDGVQAGDEVVLADVDQAIDGASSELNERGGFGPPAGITFRQGGPGGAGGGPRVGVSAG